MTEAFRGYSLHPGSYPENPFCRMADYESAGIYRSCIPTGTHHKTETSTQFAGSDLFSTIYIFPSLSMIELWRRVLSWSKRRIRLPSSVIPTRLNVMLLPIAGRLSTLRSVAMKGKWCFFMKWRIRVAMSSPVSRREYSSSACSCVNLPNAFSSWQQTEVYLICPLSARAWHST